MAEAYRAMFINLDDFLGTVLRLVPDASRILEIGCGDGAVADRVARYYPSARYVGIDTADDAGRRYSRDRAMASFHTMSSTDFRATEPGLFDLVLIVDVLHHVGTETERVGLVADAAALTAPNGTIIVKEWARSSHPAFLAGAFADRYVTGDRHVRFADHTELMDLLASGAPGFVVRDADTVRPWACNTLLALHRR